MTNRQKQALINLSNNEFYPENTATLNSLERAGFVTWNPPINSFEPHPTDGWRLTFKGSLEVGNLKKQIKSYQGD